MRIAVVRNRSDQGVINHFGQKSPETYGRKSVQAVLDALRGGGHVAAVFEGDMTLLHELKEFMPPDPLTGRPTGMVFNMSYGSQGEARYSQVPVMLEMAGVPYTGSGPRAHAICLDKALTKLRIQQEGILTPPFCLMGGLNDLRKADALTFPLVVKPRFESTSYGLALVHDREELGPAVERIVTEFRQDALVEEYIEGREIAVALLGNGSAGILPLTEIDFGGRSLRMVTGSDKFHKTSDEPQKLCPAPLDGASASLIREVGLGVFRACQCRDYARVDIRLDHQGRPFVLEINSMASLGQGGAYVTAARAAGYDFNSLILRIVDVAHERYFECPAPLDGATDLAPNQTIS
jgi:D-alanine-D-alanine ligase